MKKGIILQTFTLLLVCVAFYGCVPDFEETTGNIRGKIVDSQSDEPMQGVTVSISPGGTSSVTGSDGIFEFLNLSPSQYSLQAQKAGYKTNYKQISILAGETGIGDMSLTPLQTTSSVKIVPENLDFGKNETDMTFEIQNHGNDGSIKWNISGVEATWIRVNPTSGEIGQGMSASVKISVDRSMLINENTTTFIQVNIPGGSKSVKIRATK